MFARRSVVQYKFDLAERFVIVDIFLVKFKLIKLTTEAIINCVEYGM